MNTDNLLILANIYSSHVGRSEATLSNWIFGNARLFKRLHDGCSCNVATYNKALNWFSNNWSDDLEWPTSIERPKPTREGDHAA